MLKMAQKLTLLMFVVFGLLAIQTFDHVACSERDKGNARRPACTKRPCGHGPCNTPPCTKCNGGPWGTGTCGY
uniref:Putative secreted peptide of 4.3 kDa n=2 Tax=Ixodes pacificus TaxID=29930 RepID=Q6B880_IXOPA|nr:putative secreted peptide of 4.3 kDa [Ixodes pacificus]